MHTPQVAKRWFTWTPINLSCFGGVPPTLKPLYQRRLICSVLVQSGLCCLNGFLARKTGQSRNLLHLRFLLRRRGGPAWGQDLAGCRRPASPVSQRSEDWRLVIGGASNVSFHLISDVNLRMFFCIVMSKFSWLAVKCPDEMPLTSCIEEIQPEYSLIGGSTLPAAEVPRASYPQPEFSRSGRGPLATELPL